MRGYAFGGEVDVIVQVRQVPLKARGIGQHSHRIFVEMGNAVYDFEYDLSAGGFSYAPVDGGGGAGGLVDADDTDGGKCRFDFVDG